MSGYAEACKVFIKMCLELQPSDHKVKFRVQKQTVSAKEIFDWLCHQGHQAQQAISIGKKMVELGLIVGVSEMAVFQVKSDILFNYASTSTSDVFIVRGLVQT